MKWIQPVTLEAFLNISQKEAGFFDSFVYEPTNAEELDRGYLFILGEIRTGSPNFTYFLNFLASIIRREYYSANGKDPEAHLASVFERINENPERLFANQLPSLFGNIHILVGALVKNTLVLGFTGDMRAMLLKQGDATDLTALAPLHQGKETKQKLFSHLVTGEVELGDRLLFATQNVFDNLYRIGLIRSLSSSSFPSEQEFQKFLRQHRFNIKTKGVLHYILLSQASSLKDGTRRLDHYTPSLTSISSPRNMLTFGARIARPIFWLGVTVPVRLARLTFETGVRHITKIIVPKTTENKENNASNSAAPKEEGNREIKNIASPKMAMPSIHEPPPPYTQTILGGSAILQKRQSKILSKIKILIALSSLSAIGVIAGFLFIPQRHIETPPKTSFLTKDPSLLRMEVIPSPAMLLLNQSLSETDAFVVDRKTFYFFDRVKNTIARFHFETREASTLPAESDLQGMYLAAIIEPSIAILAKQGLLTFDLATLDVEPLEQSFFKEQDLGLPRGKVFESWHDALYWLKPQEGEIYRFAISVYGLGSEKKWVLPISSKRPMGAIDFAIDGTIYALFPDGTIDVYLKGEYQKTISWNIEPPLASADKIFTSYDQSYIWILERKNSRIIILTKEGVFVKQLHFPHLSDIKDIYVAKDNALYFLQSDKLYTHKVSVK